VDTSFGAECAEEFTMARSRRRTYTPEFKAEAVRLVRTSSASMLQIARDLGVSPAALRTWSGAAAAPSLPPLKEGERVELQRLRREVRELRMERDILKKATAFFAKHSE
jgi:transposase-like protein